MLTSGPFRATAPHLFPRFHRAVARITNGRTLLDSAGAPLLLLRSKGARTGQTRETPLAAVPLESGSFYVVGSNFARETPPAWTANLIAHPEAEVLFRGETTPMRARLLSDDERETAWPTLLRVFPAWERYTSVTERRFRVFELAPMAEHKAQP